MENRGRPKENTEAPIKFKLKTDEALYYFDRNIHKSGTVRVDIKNDNNINEPEIIPTQKYVKEPVVVIYKTSNRKKAQIKLKKYSKNIDWVLSEPKLPGIPTKAIWLEVGIGRNFIKKWKEKYNL